jgi:hypothetical protein
MCGRCPLWRTYSETPTSVAASAPNMCEMAVRCGTAVMGIQIAIGAPISEPRMRPRMIQS